jgi:general secretion pathway protein H
MRKPSGIDEQQAFTLLEVLVTLAVLTLLMVAIPIALPRVAPSQQLRVDTDTLSAVLRSTRDEAVLAGRIIPITVDAGTAQLATTGGHTLWQAASGMRLSWQPLGAGLELTFFPDGSTSGGTLRLELGNSERAVEVSPLTGRVAVQPSS